MQRVAARLARPSHFPGTPPACSKTPVVPASAAKKSTSTTATRRPALLRLTALASSRFVATTPSSSSPSDRRRPATMAAVQVVLLDIEGTVCPISFVKDVLYPYALQALPATLASQWDSPAFAPYRDAFPPEHRASPAALEAHVRDLVARDVKASYLKSLQGLLWDEGYRTGALQAPLFPDVLPALAAWHRRGIALMIYSSGSVAAQKLLFQHTRAEGDDQESTGTGHDVTPLLSDYFDTVNAGPKTAAASYAAILAAHRADLPDAGRWLFLSDNVLEVAAAKEAGMQSYVVQRPGNAPLPASAAEAHRVVTTFADLAL